MRGIKLFLASPARGTVVRRKSLGRFGITPIIGDYQLTKGPRNTRNSESTIPLSTTMTVVRICEPPVLI